MQQLITKKKRRVHASRLKFYHDASLNISEKWLGHVSRQNEPLTIEELKDIRWNREVKDYQVFVKWDGLDEVENSWEPMKKLFKDIPKMLATYCEDKSPDIKKNMALLLQPNEQSAANKKRKRDRPNFFANPKSGTAHKKSKRSVRSRGE